MMLPVESRSEIEENVLKLRSYIQSLDADDREFASGLIQRGACFVGLSDVGGVVFGPSRFVGYIENSRLKHTRNDVKDGKETNRAISRALGGSPRQDAELEQRYREFCKSFGIPLNASGPGGRPRKFWAMGSNLGV